ncbi:MAG: AAA family ATPase, partial [Solirubrobacteraceae bacterium]|nr:AAA family ATPase [Solirubrobacteraceae bacterium]
MRAQLQERGEEIAKIEEALARARGGSAELLLVEAAAGSGKSELVAAAHAAATTHDVHILRARGGELERDYAFGAVRQLFGPVIDRAAPEQRARRLAGVAAPAARIFDDLGGEASAESLQAGFAVASGLHGLVTNLAGEHPLLLTVDDAHWVDPASVRWLDFLARRLEGLPVVVLVAFRPNEPGADAAGLDQLRAHPGAVRLHPAPLSEDGVAAVLSGQGSDAHDRDQIAAYHRASGGNPLYLQELLRLGPLTTDELTRAAVPELGDRVVRRIAKASPDAPKLAAAMAVLGDGAALRHAAELSGLDAAPAAALARQLGQIDILATQDPVTFVHPLVRASVEENLDTAVRADLHRRAATLLHEAGASIEAVAAHLALLAPSGSDEVATLLLAAGRDAVSRAAPAAAVARFQRALDERASLPPRADLLFELGQAQMAMRDPAAVGSLQEACQHSTTPATMVGAAVTLGELLSHAGRWREAVDVVLATRAKVNPADEDLLAELEAFRAVFTSHDSKLVGDFDRDLPEFERIAGGASWPARALAGLLAAIASARGADTRAVTRLLDHAVAGGHVLTRAAGAWASAQIVGTMIEREDYTRAAAFAEEVEHTGRRTGVMLAVVTGSGFNALADLRRGRVADAERRLLDVMALSSEAEMPMWQITLATFAAEAVLERPALAPLIALADSIQIEDGFAASASGAMLLEARGVFALSRGDRLRAASELRSAGAAYTPLGWGPPRTFWRSYLAIALA